MILINLREGRVGNQESTFIITIAMCLSGLFVFESSRAYNAGNSTYLSIPIACLLGYLIFGIVSLAMKRVRSSDFHDLVITGLGKQLGPLVCVALIIILLSSTCSLLNRFLNIMHSYFFPDADYFQIALYVFAVITIFACMGLETISRTSKIIGILLIAVQLLLLFNSMSGYEAYKIYPVAGDGGEHMLRFSFESVIYFLPAILTALITVKGEHGIKNASKNVRKATIIAVVVCGITQLLLGFAYTYDDLSELYMPLYRMSMITGHENFLIRLDNISAFVWLSGAMLASGYYLYGASLLYCRTFKQLDIRPAASSLGLIVIVVCLMSHSGEHAAFEVLDVISRYGTLFVFVPLMVISCIALIKGSLKQKGRGNV